MRHVPAIAGRELAAYFLGPTAYLVFLGFQVVAFLNFWELVESLASPRVEFSSLRDPMSAYISGGTPFWFGVLVAIPVLTMRLLAEERRSGTIEMLATAPVTEGEIVVGKWLAGAAMYMTLLIPFAMYLPFLHYQGRYPFDVGPFLSLGIGLTTMGMAFVAIGLFFSALTRSQVVAAIWTFVALFVLVVMTLLAAYYPASRGWTGWSEAARRVAVIHQIHELALGRLDLRTIASHLSACGLALYATTALLAARRTTAPSRAVLNTALVAGVLLVGNVIAFRYGGIAFDLTRERTHTLSSQSRNQLRSLDEPVTFHLVHGRSALARRREDRVAQLLELYRSARPDLARVERLDRYAELARGDELSRRSPELSMMPGGGVLIEFGEGSSARFAAIGNQEMFESEGPEPGRGVGVYASSFRGEDAITSALIRLRDRVAVKVGFTVGHGESGPERAAAEGSGIEHWKARLTAAGCEATPINLLEGPIPDDVDLLVVAGPKEAFKPPEAARLREYADRGGPVLACLDGSAPTGLEEFLKSFNLELGPGRIVDPRLNLNGRASFVFCLLEPALRHPTTDGVTDDRAALIVNGSPIHLVGTPGAADESPTAVNHRMLPSIVLRSGPSSWVEAEPAAPALEFDKGKDRPGPAATIAAVAERDSPPKPRLVLISSRAAGDDAVVEAEPANLDILMNAAAWLRGRRDSIGVPAKVHAALTLVADPSLRWRLTLAPTVVVAAGVIALGVLVHLIRRD